MVYSDDELWGEIAMTHAHARAWDDGGADWAPGWASRLAVRWGHHAPQVLIGAVVAMVLLGAAPGPAGALATVSPLLLLAVVLVTWVQLRRHDRGLCELCVRSMPLNASQEAVRLARRLALVHAASRPAVVVPWFALLLASDLAVGLAPPALLGTVVVAWALVQASLVYAVLCHVTHRRLQPWCPRCRGGGGGEHQEQPDPVPLDHSGR